MSTLSRRYLFHKLSDLYVSYLSPSGAILSLKSASARIRYYILAYAAGPHQRQDRLNGRIHRLCYRQLSAIVPLSGHIVCTLASASPHLPVPLTS